MKKANSEVDLADSTDKDMENLAQYFLNLYTNKEVDYYKKYGITMEEVKEPTEVYSVSKEDNRDVSTEKNDKLTLELTQYRLAKSKEEKIKPYLLYNNKQMEDLIGKMPKTIEDLMCVSGFGEVKCQKYGQDILNILQKYRVNV